jgi:transposase
MLRVDQVHVIRHKVLVEKQSIRRVARELGVHRDTVRKYLREPEPVRHEVEARPKPVFEEAKARIDALLEEWRGRTTQKQHVTGTRVHAVLLAEGKRVGLTLVRGYLRELKRQKAEVYVPLVHRPGDSAQVDFFEVVVEIEGVQRKAWKFLFRLMHSGRDFAWLYERADQIAFLDGHVRAFTHLDAVPERCVYDNLKAAVRKLAQVGRELTERFAALSNHYSFEPCFARPGEGHDKGGVEGRGKNLRLQHLVPIPKGASLAAISGKLLQDLDAAAAEKRDEKGRSVLERFKAERDALRALPPTHFEARKAESFEVSSKSMVLLGGGWYSVPSSWARLTIMAYVGPDDVRFVCRGETVTRPRVGFGERHIRYRDYLPELAELTGELGEPFGKLWTLLATAHGGLEAARVLAKLVAAITRQGEPSVRAAIERALAPGDAMGTSAPLGNQPTPSTIPVPDSLKGYEVEAASARDYDHLLVGAAS